MPSTSMGLRRTARQCLTKRHKRDFLHGFDAMIERVMPSELRTANGSDDNLKAMVERVA